MNLENHEKAILSVYRNQSFTKAAAELGISQPALSASISKIENTLGIRLFERKRTPIRPTDEGMVYIEYLKQTQKQYQECMNRIDDIRGSRNATITIGAPNAYANSYLPEKIASFHKAYPECRIIIRTGTLPELVELCSDGLIDCFVSTSSKLDTSFVIREIAKERLFLCVPKDWALNDYLKKVDTKQISDSQVKKDFDWTLFEGADIICLEENQPLQKVVNTFIKKAKVPFNTPLVVNQVLLGVNMVAKGMGMMFASDTAIAGCNDPASLCTYPLPENVGSRTIYIAYNENNYISESCRKFMDMLGEK